MKEILKLAVPVVLSYLGIMLMAVVDLAFVGRVSATAMGAVGLGSSLFMWVMIFGIGILTGLDFLVSYAFGAGRKGDGHRALVQGLWVSVLLGAPLTVLLWFAGGWLPALGVSPEVVPPTASYLRILSFSLMPVLLFTASRQYLQALGIARPATVILVIANGINAAANYAFVFGRWGAPELGADGSAIATLVSRVWMMGAMVGYLVWWDGRGERLFSRLPLGFDAAEMRKLLRLGIPAALQMTFEVGVFATATALAARLAPEQLAAHHTVLNIASMTFMVPLGIGSAAAVLVGQAVGRGDPRLARSTGWKCLGLGVGFMACSCLVFLLAPHALLGAYTTDPAVLEAGVAILFIAALFQLSDGTQVVSTGILRGLGDTRTPMYANLVGHWLLGLPLGVYLCFHAHGGLRGLWIGLSVGLTSVAAALIFAQVRKKAIA